MPATLMVVTIPLKPLQGVWFSVRHDTEGRTIVQRFSPCKTMQTMMDDHSFNKKKKRNKKNALQNFFQDFDVLKLHTTLFGLILHLKLLVAQ